jgi:hypothetical protein
VFETTYTSFCRADMGINSFVTLNADHCADDGPFTFELQFHTPESLAMKMGSSHALYLLAS